VDDEASLSAAGSLADPLRRRLYDLVVASEQPVGRDEAAAATGASRSVTAYHLDQLVADGLLDTSYARRDGRTGPGAGRPAKLYRPAPGEVVVQLPPRDDALVADLLASAIEADGGEGARAALRTVARRYGERVGQELADEDLLAALARRGYAPVQDPDGVRLRNCPFHHLVGDHVELVCGLNEALLAAVVTAAGSPYEAVLRPQPGRCCVVLRPSASR